MFGGEPIRGSLAYCASQQNKPTALIEIGGGGKNNQHYIEEGLKGIKNIMKYLGMLNGMPELPEKQIVVNEIVSIRSKSGGLLYPYVGLDSMNTIVDRQKELGVVYSPYTFEKMEVFRGPFDQNMIVLLVADVCRIEVGEVAYMLGNMDTAKTI